VASFFDFLMLVFNGVFGRDEKGEDKPGD